MPRAPSEPSGWKDSHPTECQAFLVLDAVWGPLRADEKTEAQGLNDLSPKGTCSRAECPRPVSRVPVSPLQGRGAGRSSEEGARQRAFLPVEGRRAAVMTRFPRSSDGTGAWREAPVPSSSPSLSQLPGVTCPNQLSQISGLLPQP